MIDVKRYIEKKEKGLISLVKLGNAYAISWKTYDPETGVEKNPVVEAIGMEDLKKVREQANELLKGIDMLIIDLEALKGI